MPDPRCGVLDHTAFHGDDLARTLEWAKGREEALQAFTEWMDLDEARAFASLTFQSETLGSSISDALRTYAEDMRHRRLMAAEAKAQQLSVKLSIPLIVLILPALILVITTPAAQKIARTFLPILNDPP